VTRRFPSISGLVAVPQQDDLAGGSGEEGGRREDSGRMSVVPVYSIVLHIIRFCTTGIHCTVELTLF